MKVIHFADLHIGNDAHGSIDAATGLNTRTLDVLRVFDELVEYALSNDIDAVIFAGDAFKSRTPSPTQQGLFAARIKSMAAVDIPVVLVPGNHDMLADPMKATSIDIFRTLATPGVFVARRDEVFHLETASGLLQVACLPWPMRQRLHSRDGLRGKSQELIKAEANAAIAACVGGLAERCDDGLPTILAAHLTVAGATFGCERDVMLGSDVVVMPDVLSNPAFGYVALGHIHKRQVVTEKVVYSGSLDRCDFGEQDDNKGFVVVEFDDGGKLNSWDFVDVSATKFVTIKSDASTADNPTACVQQETLGVNVDDAIVRVIVDLKASNAAAFRGQDIRQALEIGGARRVNVIERIERQERQRIKLDAPPHEMEPEDLLRAFFESNGKSEEEIAALMPLADEIILEVQK